MNTIKTLLIVAAITLTNIVSAGNNPISEKPSISKEISSLLVGPNFQVDQEMLAKITFITNKNNEIIVLDVDTESELLESFIKARLNYNVMATKLVKNVTYELPVKIVVE